MGSHTRNRRCGCDCRDDEHYDEEIQGESYSCCDVCEENERPCRWIAKIDCSEITFAQCCQFDEGCVYLGFDISSLQNMPDRWCSWDYLFRVWYGTNPEPCNVLVREWDLNLSTKQVTWTKMTGSIVDGIATWEKQSDWSCNEANTLLLIDDGGLEGLPKFVCVVPDIGQQLDSCNDHGTGLDVDYIVRDDCYTDDSDRCTCCDDCCECFGVTVNGDCSGTPVTNSGQACVGGRTGLSDPAGVSREYCFNVNDGYGSHEICLVFYCNGTSWKLDVLCDGVFDSEGTVSAHTCCPLRFTFTFAVSCLECSFCGCVGEEDCDCDPPIVVDCCPGAEMPSTISISDGTETVSATWNGAYWQATNSFSWCPSDTGMSLTCSGGSFLLSSDPSGQSCGPTGTCDPLLLTCTFFDCSANPQLLTITA